MTIQRLPGAATPRYFGNSPSPSRTASPCCPDRPSAILARRSWEAQSIVSSCGPMHMVGHLRWQALFLARGDPDGRRRLFRGAWRPEGAPATLRRRLFLVSFRVSVEPGPLGLGPARVPQPTGLARPLTHLCPSVGAPWVSASHVCLSSSDLPPHSPPRPVGPRSVSLSAAHVPFAHPHRPPPAAAALASLPP
jgi:hypothetical protein